MGRRRRHRRRKREGSSNEGIQAKLPSRTPHHKAETANYYVIIVLFMYKQGTTDYLITAWCTGDINRGVVADYTGAVRALGLGRIIQGLGGTWQASFVDGAWLAWGGGTDAHAGHGRQDI